jgi:hypothetical protein
MMGPEKHLPADNSDRALHVGWYGKEKTQEKQVYKFWSQFSVMVMLV